MNKDALALAEYHARESALFSLETLNQARARAHSLLLVLLSGGAGMGALGLAQVQIAPMLGWPALMAGAWWFAWAAWVAWRGLTTRKVHAWSSGASVLQKWPDWLTWAEEEKREDEAAGKPVENQTADWLVAKALAGQRAALVSNMQAAAATYRSASHPAHVAVDLALRAVTLGTPLMAAIAAGLVFYLRR